ncbi:hypothetical protein DHEL01_v205275 [Diaporthe helianthi]|uniref:Uncharacterized protein n=1 Tax=Diaporthe helianthi TaxID=158607 RepID=A0A2P5I1F4_DIAHE|nr:hypothetical protein DHEL01_v205275 [Diaporthe helianthi]
MRNDVDGQCLGTGPSPRSAAMRLVAVRATKYGVRSTGEVYCTEPLDTRTGPGHPGGLGMVGMELSLELSLELSMASARPLLQARVTVWCRLFGLLIRSSGSRLGGCKVGRVQFEIDELPERLRCKTWDEQAAFCLHKSCTRRAERRQQHAGERERLTQYEDQDQDMNMGVGMDLGSRGCAK